MGIYTMGPHREAALELAQITGAQCFIETGTYKGKTTRWAAENFETVHTVEKAAPFYDRYHQELTLIGNIITHFGDSRERLPQIVETLAERPALFWLDGHWSGGVTAGADDECPILDELQAIMHRRKDIIMIDDARLFLAAPPNGFDADQWPTIFQISQCLGDYISDYFIAIFHDIIFLVPQEPALISTLRKWSRAHAAAIGREATG